VKIAITVREVSEEVGISKSSCHTILTAKFVLRLLTDEQKANCITVSQELFDLSNADKNFLKNVITGDETWVYGYDIETKAQSSQWVGNSLPRPKEHVRVM
jgi:predicted AAA+ superfamily ATPase